ncbi:MAG: DNA topoisomerase 4 subunit A [Lachnospiraceae bacterium]|nr:DNA topoisomerase 4 subunit A [Lachnospiraceae bacterium]
MPVIDNIISTEYSEIMRKSYIDYAMSVIIARALPDIRDGLKPVQRRTLYDMSELGIRHDRPYRKCARIVGDTMGKYHPHGDSSIYDALVVLAQDFKKGCALVDGHGNFGSIEGDGAAAMRYTEARLQKITEEAFLSDLDKDTVDFIPNFDETEKEPSVLPVLIPNFLINGSEGIAVGMATSTPPHNLSEVIEAEKAYMKNRDITTEELMTYVKGPDFPTGGIVVNEKDLLQIYESGEGKIRVRGRIEVEKAKGGKQNLVVTEIPYTMIGAGIGKFMSDVAALVESRKTNDITDISNQSGKDGIRIVIELKKDADAENIKNLLYQKTKLEDTFGVNMLAVSNGRPETMGLKQILAAHVGFLYEVNTRKYTSLLTKEREKREVQEGLIRAVDCIDLIIMILRGSKSRAQAMDCLVKGKTEGIAFHTDKDRKDAEQLLFSERQATAILDMRLYRLIGLEITALRKEYGETLKKIAKYEDLLSDTNSMGREIRKDLDRFQKEYGRERRTSIENAKAAVFEEKPLEETDVYFVMDRFGYVKTLDTNTYERNKETVLSEYRYCIFTRNTDKICLFTEDGNMHTVKCLDVPVGKLRDKGVPIDNISNYDSSKEIFIYVDCMENIRKQKFLFLTKQAMAKFVEGGEFDVSKRSVAATKLSEGDSLLAIMPVNDENRQIFLQSKEGFFLRFPLDEIPDKKKAAIGVRAMKLSEKDSLEAVYFMNFADERTIEYMGQEMPLTYVKNTHRDGKGTKVRL